MAIRMWLGAGAVSVMGLAGSMSVQTGTAQAGEVESRFGVISAVPVAADTVALQVTSVFGWTCEGIYAAPEQSGAAVRFPLKCSDDVKGKALMAVEDGRAAVMFQREDGTKGSAAVTLN